MAKKEQLKKAMGSVNRIVTAELALSPVYSNDRICEVVRKDKVIEIRFNTSKYCGMTNIEVVSIKAATTLRDKLNQLLAQEDV